MNIVHLHNRDGARPEELHNLFNRMESALLSAHADIEKSIRLAKTLAPILNDESSNDRHLATIFSSAPVHEKVIAILMLGFPKNQRALPTLQNILHEGVSSMRMAAVIAITQMRDGENNATLREVLSNAYEQEKTLEVKRALHQALHNGTWAQ